MAQVNGLELREGTSNGNEGSIINVTVVKTEYNHLNCRGRNEKDSSRAASKVKLGDVRTGLDEEIKG